MKYKIPKDLENLEDDSKEFENNFYIQIAKEEAEKCGGTLKIIRCGNVVSTLVYIPPQDENQTSSSESFPIEQTLSEPYNLVDDSKTIDNTENVKPNLKNSNNKKTWYSFFKNLFVNQSNNKNI